MKTSVRTLLLCLVLSASLCLPVLAAGFDPAPMKEDPAYTVTEDPDQDMVVVSLEPEYKSVRFQTPLSSRYYSDITASIYANPSSSAGVFMIVLNLRTQKPLNAEKAELAVDGKKYTVTGLQAPVSAMDDKESLERVMITIDSEAGAEDFLNELLSDKGQWKITVSGADGTVSFEVPDTARTLISAMLRKYLDCGGLLGKMEGASVFAGN